MAISHFTLHECPNPNCPSNQVSQPPARREVAVGDPVARRWHCFACERGGEIMFLIDGSPDQ